MKQLIINMEYFLQCFGHCSGCFLSEEERQESNVYKNTLLLPLLNLSKKYKKIEIEHLVVGLGRGNILNLSAASLEEMLSFISKIESLFQYKKITLEISTSLIGKIDLQIEKALFLLSRNKNIYFNLVINSELTSSTFWQNIGRFYQATSSYRINNWNWTDNYGDILVLNINPENLPDLNFIENFTLSYGSPINISIFPFQNKITKDSLKKLNDWTNTLWYKFKDKDLNIKNYLVNLNASNIENNLENMNQYQSYTEKSYYFIDKMGKLINGSLSIMGEVDKIRLLEKFGLKLNINEAYTSMQKHKACRLCPYQKECLLSGSYLNFMANKKNYNDGTYCLSGYKNIFSAFEEYRN